MPTYSDFIHTFDPSIPPSTCRTSEALEITLPSIVNPPHPVLSPCSHQKSPNAHLQSSEVQLPSTTTTSTLTIATSN